ncbi:MAG: hypothetical protein ABI295_00390 [Xanthomarina sp.]
MKSHKKRKEVVLDEKTLAILEEKAKSQGRNLKNYMEFILNEEANNILEEPKALEVRKALLLSRSQNKEGLVKANKDVIQNAKQRVNANSVDKAS